MYPSKPAAVQDIFRDLQRCRDMIDDALGRTGWHHSRALGDLKPPCTFEHLPILTLIELPPEPH